MENRKQNGQANPHAPTNHPRFLFVSGGAHGNRGDAAAHLRFVGSHRLPSVGAARALMHGETCGPPAPPPMPAPPPANPSASPSAWQRPRRRRPYASASPTASPTNIWFQKQGLQHGRAGYGDPVHLCLSRGSTGLLRRGEDEFVVADLRLVAAAGCGGAPAEEAELILRMRRMVILHILDGMLRASLPWL